MKLLHFSKNLPSYLNGKLFTVLNGCFVRSQDEFVISHWSFSNRHNGIFFLFHLHDCHPTLLFKVVQLLLYLYYNCISIIICQKNCFWVFINIDKTAVFYDFVMPMTIWMETRFSTLRESRRSKDQTISRSYRDLRKQPRRNHQFRHLYLFLMRKILYCRDTSCFFDLSTIFNDFKIIVTWF